MDASKILLILCCFILIVCFTFCISTLTVLRNTVDESRAVQTEAAELVDQMESLLSEYRDSSIPVLGETSDADRFVLRETDGRIGIFTIDGYLLHILDVAVDTLPANDRAALASGIPLSSWKELISWVQDYTA
ncbi:MAG: hypothetical protein E7666_00195 [Ruminococcaceae bacterium]|nr:hypothetical protein [Oscillospiraceae bacterium]